MKSLKKRLTVCIIALMAILSAVNLTVGIWSSYNGMIQNIRLDLEAMRQIGDVAFSAKVQAMKKDAVTVAALPALISGSAETKMESVQPYVDQYECIAISVVDANGTVFSSNEAFNGRSIAQKDYFQRARQGETVLSTTEVENGTAFMNACTRIKMAKDECYILMVFDGNALSDVIKSITVGKSGNLFALDQTGAFIASKNPDLINTRQNLIEEAKTDPSKKTAAELYSRMVAKETDIQNYVYLGKERVCAFAPISGTDGWSFGVVAPVKEMIASLSQTVILMLAATAIFLIVGILIAVRLSRKIATPIEEITRRMRLLEQGDLTSSVPDTTAKDEIGVLAQSFAQAVQMVSQYVLEISRGLAEISKGNFAIQLDGTFKGDFAPMKQAIDVIGDSLSETIGNINRASDQVAGGSGQVSSGAQALSQGATEQASSVQELSATIAEISSQVSETAKNAKQARAMTDEAGRMIGQSNQEMDKMITAMSDISSRSGEISKIIKTIEDIAFQTNILALNAAVEAARAGAAGKGFAVVADEVRNLAGKSANAAKNTTDLISETVRAVENGTAIADATAQSMRAVVDSAEQAADLVQLISDAAQSQARSISQVTQGIDQISSVVQTNSATAEQSAAASEELSSQAQMLKGLVSRFRIKGMEAGDNGQNTLPGPAGGTALPDGGNDTPPALRWDIGSY